MEDKLIPIAEVSERGLLPYRPSAIKRLIATGEIVAVNIGRGKVPRYALTEIEISRVNAELKKKTT